jgi:two-component system response regulator
VKAAEIQILLVEDDDDDAAAALRAFKESGMDRRVLRLNDGAEAVEYLQKSRNDPPPRLILLDMNLPRLGGLDVLAAVRADPRTQGVPVVMLTNCSRREDVARSYSMGANSFIVKPSGSDEFSAAVVGAGSYWMTWNTAP